MPTVCVSSMKTVLHNILSEKIIIFMYENAFWLVADLLMNENLVSIFN